jgi:hypothetical protein
VLLTFRNKAEEAASEQRQGRSAERDRAVRWFAGVGGCRDSRTYFESGRITGSPGIGKTSLHERTVLASESEWLVSVVRNPASSTEPMALDVLLLSEEKENTRRAGDRAAAGGRFMKWRAPVTFLMS